ncbi:DUF6046 domain-containing protein [Chryseobacterium sp. MFBS3-17]|uniref:DUF6046 domain-containing protein n=1 Tax=Chryseobacterium sp. MFBS3-17 TaxID=2886689 RepID=UPI001D0EA02D|nr:DUF6046 domain-containing protein [Chryseobacterium sp. MFBS3-17]MCC2590362.1 DUF6046 domain-containing protein [Chryseobacterium sp. MFBS3-17]
MRLSNENALIASLMGSKVVEQLPRFAAVEASLQKYVTPPVRLLPLLQNEDEIWEPESSEETDLWRNDRRIQEENQFFPFSFRASADENWWLLPWEPMINIEASNSITRRTVAKAGKNQIGSIKERWSTEDYNITITGALYGDRMMGKSAQTYPRYEMEKLRDYLLTPEAIEVMCEPLQILNINRIVIESVSFPFTKGEDVQAYEIRAISDFPYDLIYKRKQ